MQSVFWRINASEDVDGIVRLRIMQERQKKAKNITPKNQNTEDIHHWDNPCLKKYTKPTQQPEVTTVKTACPIPPGYVVA